MQPIRTETLPGMRLVGHHRRFDAATMSEIPALWSEFVAAMESIPNRMGEDTFGLIWDDWTKGDYFEYMAAVQVSPATDKVDGFETVDVPVCRYAIFEHTGPISTLMQTLDAIYTQWLPNSSSERARFPSRIEIYGDRFHPETMDGTMEIWVALA